MKTGAGRIAAEFERVLGACGQDVTIQRSVVEDALILLRHAARQERPNSDRSEPKVQDSRTPLEQFETAERELISCMALVLRDLSEAFEATQPSPSSPGEAVLADQRRLRARELYPAFAAWKEAERGLTRRA